MRAVNLLAYETTVERRSLSLPRFNPVHAAAAAGAIVLVAVTGLYVSARSDATAHAADVAALEREHAALQAAAGRRADAEALLADRRARGAAVAAALEHRVAWDVVLNRVARVLPDGVWLTGLQADAPSVPASAAQPGASEEGGSAASAPPPAAAPAASEATPAAFSATGYAFDQKAVALALDRLALVPDLAGVQLVSSTKTTLLGRSVRQFTISATVRKGGK